MGAVNTVNARFKEAKQEVEEEYVGTKALVLVNNKAKEVSNKLASLHLRAVKASSRFDRDGYMQGREAGKRVNLTRGSLGGGTKGYLS